MGNGASAEAKDSADDQKIAVTDYAEDEEVKALDEKHAEPINLKDSDEDQNKTVGDRDDRNKEPYRIAKGPGDRQEGAPSQPSSLICWAPVKVQ